MEENLISKPRDFSKLNFYSKLEVLARTKPVLKNCLRHQYEKIPHFRNSRTVLKKRVAAP